jgi:hypothetical protein
MCVNCADCSQYYVCSPSEKSIRLNGNNCMDYLDTEDDGEYRTDRWREMSYKKYTNPNCLNCEDELDDEDDDNLD